MYYVETYFQNSKRAETWRELLSISGVLKWASENLRPGTILRIIAPHGAPKEAIAAIRALGNVILN